MRGARPYLLAIAFGAIAVAVAGPQAGVRLVPLFEQESNRVIAIDLSNSMAAQDVGTSRLAAAKAIARRIVENQDGRIGLIAFEGSAEVISPLTNDAEAILALLDTLQPGEVGHPGSDISAAINGALRLIEADPNQKSDVVIISDGEEQGGRLTDALRRARTRGVTIHAISVGTAAGAVIPAGEGVLRDESGEIVTTRANPVLLGRVARSSEGLFFENPFSAHSLDSLIARRVGGPAKERPVRMPIDRYQWPLAIAFAAFLGGSLLNRGAE
jgi:Ca-activated chloride channel family protein